MLYVTKMKAVSSVAVSSVASSGQWVNLEAPDLKTVTLMYNPANLFAPTIPLLCLLSINDIFIP